MRHIHSMKIIWVFLLILFLVHPSTAAREQFEELTFDYPADAESDLARTLQSLKKIQGTGRFCQDGLYLLTHFGDRSKVFQEENQKMMDHPLMNQTWRHCSLFSATHENSVVMGRNWDNQNVGSIIISYYRPAGGYASVSFTRSIDLGFGHKDLTPHTKSIFGKQLLLAPFYSFDGINEHGLAVGVAGVRQVVLKPGSDKNRVYVPYLVRKILDQTRNIDQAVTLVNGYIPFDLDKNSLNTHFLVVDASGRSVILEYERDRWNAIYGRKSWQVLTNKSILDEPESALRKKCRRYRIISETLEVSDGNLDWRYCMKILRNAAQVGTSWSVVYFPFAKDLYFSIYQNWDAVYRLTPF